MAVKKTATKKLSKATKKTGLMLDIAQLATSIANSNAALGKLYKKAVSETEKKLLAAKKEWSKSIQAKAKKKSSSDKKAAINAIQAIKQNIATLKVEKNHLTGEYKKWLSQQKMVDAFEKTWNKKNKVTPVVKMKKKALKSKKAIKINKEPQVEMQPSFEAETVLA